MIILSVKTSRKYNTNNVIQPRVTDKHIAHGFFKLKIEFVGIEIKFLLIQKISCVYGHAIWYGSNCDFIGIGFNSN